MTVNQGSRGGPGTGISSRRPLRVFTTPAQEISRAECGCVRRLTGEVEEAEEGKCGQGTGAGKGKESGCRKGSGEETEEEQDGKDKVKMENNRGRTGIKRTKKRTRSRT